MATRRTARTLAAHPWRPVDCEVRMPRRVVSVPGGARPLGVAMSTADNRNP
ncbi:hypothetical protein [Streptomyces sp. 4N124]|uniref:hypothetical protein n=1 Tax=Streptomyces sp. 4N124 TaxID=3457420 RepID=UPI003FD113DF